MDDPLWDLEGADLEEAEGLVLIPILMDDPLWEYIL